MVLASVIAGAAGGGIANVALTPMTGGAGLLQSYWYGAGLILGERMMYTFHWEKIKVRLEAGEDFLHVLESEMNPQITAIADYSMQVMHKTGDIYLEGGKDLLAGLIENLFKLLAGDPIDHTTTKTTDKLKPEIDKDLVGPVDQPGKPPPFQDDREIEKKQKELEVKQKEQKKLFLDNFADEIAFLKQLSAVTLVDLQGGWDKAFTKKYFGTNLSAR